MAHADTPDIVIYPPFLAGLAVVAALALDWVLPLGLLPPWGTGWTMALGAVFFAASGFFGLSGIAAFLKAHTHITPHKPALHLVREGPYRFTRNPMYLGIVLFMLALGFGASVDWALILTPVVWAILHYGVVLREEPYLTEKFGDDYRRFLSETRRWL
ncbi:MAG: methyltransferase family protein [Marinibacterium sp.]